LIRRDLGPFGMVTFRLVYDLMALWIFTGPATKGNASSHDKVIRRQERAP